MVVGKPVTSSLIRKLKPVLPALFCLLATPGVAGDEPVDRRIVLTFDDLPAQRHQAIGTERMERLNAEILAALEEAPGGPIPAIGFVNESKLEVEGGDGERRVEAERVEILERWLDAGMELGNHTYSHPDLHRVPLEEFERDTLRGESLVRPLLAKRDQEPRYFRHPFLHTGRSLETKRSFESFLERHGYEVAPVTVDNGEWIYARAYDRILAGEGAAAAQPGLRGRLARSYLEYMLAMVEFYEGQSRALFGREIPQILLLHANDLNGDHVGELIRRLDHRGYRFVALEDALEDPAYDSLDTYVGGSGRDHVAAPMGDHEERESVHVPGGAGGAGLGAIADGVGRDSGGGWR